MALYITDLDMSCSRPHQIESLSVLTLYIEQTVCCFYLMNETCAHISMKHRTPD